MSIQVFANHAHVFPEAVNAEGTIDRLLQMLDACDIARAVCFAPFAYQIMGRGIHHNEWLAKEIARQPRLEGFGTVDLHKHVDSRPMRDQVKQIRDLGLRGIKLHPNAQEFDILAPEVMEVYAAAQDQQLFITFHSGVHASRLKNYQVLKFDEVAEHFPALSFSLEHMGGYSFFHEALAIIVNRIPFPPIPGRRCLVYGGLTSIFTPDYCRFWYMPRERMLEAIAQATAEQFIFGLDFPYNKEANTKLALETLHGLGLPEQKLAKILGGNLKEALRIK